jgi:hypothetical protein
MYRLLEGNLLGSNDSMRLFRARTCFLDVCYQKNKKNDEKIFFPERWYFSHGFTLYP